MTLQQSDPYLSKSRYLSGLKCDRRLWFDAHDRERATPPDSSQEHIFRMGNEVGRAAQALFPNGVHVEVESEGHAAVVSRTRELMADVRVPAIFEAAFEYETVRIRVDILERLEGGRWGLREVKSSSRVKRERHLPDLAIQRWVLEGCGVEVESAELIHVNRDYERGPGEIDWPAFFVRREMTEDLDEISPERLAEQVAQMRATLAEDEAPTRAIGDFCRQPNVCRYWVDCSAVAAVAAAAALGADASPVGTPDTQDVSPAPGAKPRYSPRLADVLGKVEAPVWALDFEAIGPAIPLYPGTKPYQAIAFQWSLHRLGRDGAIDHFEFLADGRSDPRPEVARSLVERVGNEAGSILSYSGYESRCLADMARRSPELAGPLGAIERRLVDLLPIVRKHVVHPAFGGSYSMKSVGPVLAGAVAYGDLAGVADGLGALAAFAGIVAGRYSEREERALRAELLAYCQLDTRALLEFYRALVRASSV